MTRRHVLGEGESLPGIARQYGFRDWQTIYEAPENARLRERQPNPNLLSVGDVVVIPDQEPRVESAATGARHTFVVRLSHTFIRLKLLLDGPVDFTLSIEGNIVRTGTTDGSEPIVQEVSCSAKVGQLTVWHAGSDRREEEDGVSIPLDITLLGDIDQLRGVDGRLRNLDFLHGPISRMTDDSPSRVEAIKRFEVSLGLPARGVVDEELRALLLSHHDEA